MSRIRLIIVFLTILLLSAVSALTNKDNLPIQELIDGWEKYCEESGQLSRSDYPPVFKAQKKGHPFFDWAQRIIAKGPSAVPCLIENIKKIEKQSYFDLCESFRDLLIFTVKQILRIELNERGKTIEEKRTWRSYYLEFPEIFVESNVKYDQDRSKQLLLKFWQQKDKLIQNRFNTLIIEIKQHQGNKAKVDKALHKIRGLGILALPLMMDEISKGNKLFIPIVSELTDGKFSTVNTKEACMEWWSVNKSKWVLEQP